MNTYTRHGGQWVIKSDDLGLENTTITALTRGGAQRAVKLAGYIGRTQDGRYSGYLYAIAARPDRAQAAAPEAVGDLSRILAMFARARTHLKYPAIVLDGFRVSVAGARAKEPGSLTITSIGRDATDQRNRPTRAWYGRVSLTGEFQPGRDAPNGLAEKLRAFAADPAGVAAAYGHLHGACCFCNRALSDERSTAVGYGPICADHFGLPWGTASDDTALLSDDEMGINRPQAAMESAPF